MAVYTFPFIFVMFLYMFHCLTQILNKNQLLCFFLTMVGGKKNLSHFFFHFLKFYFIFKLYIIVLVLPNIKMNPPEVYMCSPS